MLKQSQVCFSVVCLVVAPAFAQEPAGSPSVPTQRITGAITTVDQSTHVVMVKEDKTSTIYMVELQNTRSLRKVDPGTLDLKTATRITAEDLIAGDRVQVFAVKAEDNPNALAARGVLLISARDLQNVHQEQAAAWQHGTPGVVTQVDLASGKVSMSTRTPQGPKPMVVDAQKAEFTRYSPDNPKVPAASKLADIQLGDQVRVIGEASGDGSSITAQRVYSSSIRTLICTVSAVAADGKQITVRDLQTKQSVTVALGNDSAVRKLPTMLAYGLARRLNPAFKGPEGAGNDAGRGANSNAGPGNGSPAGAPTNGSKQGEASLNANGGGNGGASRGAGGPWGGPGGGGGGGFQAGGGMRNGDLSQLIERLPAINATDLKPGDAVVITGTPIDNDKSRLLATNVIAGVEPIFQSASPRQMQSLGDWGLSSGAGMDGMPAQ